MVTAAERKKKREADKKKKLQQDRAERAERATIRTRTKRETRSPSTTDVSVAQRPTEGPGAPNLPGEGNVPVGERENIRRQEAFVQGRERTAALTGQSSRRVGEQFAAGVQQTEQAQLVQAEQERRETEATQFLGERGFFDESAPERVSLDIARSGGELTPIIGPGVAAGGSTGQAKDIEIDFKGVGLLASDFGAATPERLRPLIQNPQTAREFALQEIQKEVIAEGTSQAERTGAAIEAIPVIGSAVAKFAGRLIESPAENVDTILGEIDSERERASVLAESVRTGKFGNPEEAFIIIEGIEDNIIRREQRIRLLSLESAALIANGDQLNRIEEKILRAKERVFIAKQSAAAGIVAPVSDANIFQTLKDLKGGTTNE